MDFGNNKKIWRKLDIRKNSDFEKNWKFEKEIGKLERICKFGKKLENSGKIWKLRKK